MNNINLKTLSLKELTELLIFLDKKRMKIIDETTKNYSNKKLYQEILKGNIKKPKKDLEIFKETYEFVIEEKERIKKEFIKKLEEKVVNKNNFEIKRYGQGNILEYIVNIEKIPEGFIGIDFFNELEYITGLENYLDKYFNSNLEKMEKINDKTKKELQYITQKNNIDTIRIFNNEIKFIDIKGKIKLSNIDITLETAGNYDFNNGKIKDEGWLKNPLSDYIISTYIKNKDNKQNNIKYLNDFLNNKISIEEYKKYINKINDSVILFKEYYDITNKFHKYKKLEKEKQEKLDEILLYIFKKVIDEYKNNKINLGYSFFETKDLKEVKKNIEQNRLEEILKQILKTNYNKLKEIRKKGYSILSNKNIKIIFSIQEKNFYEIKKHIRTEKIKNKVEKMKYKDEKGNEKIKVLKMSIKDNVNDISFDYIVIAFLDKEMTKIVYKDRILLGNETYQTVYNTMNKDRNGSSINYSKKQIEYLKDKNKIKKLKNFLEEIINKKNLKYNN